MVKGRLGQVSNLAKIKTRKVDIYSRLKSLPETDTTPQEEALQRGGNRGPYLFRPNTFSIGCAYEIRSDWKKCTVMKAQLGIEIEEDIMI